MCQYPTHRQTVEHQDGFTLLEVLVSITILAVGLTGAALLMATTYKFSRRSRYMAEAAQLASEKLEDMSRYPAVNTVVNNVSVIEPDEHLFVPSGANYCGLSGVLCVGSIAPALTCIAVGNCTPNAAAAPLQITAGEAGAGGTVALGASLINYSDSVFISATNGSGGTAVSGSLQETFQTATGASPSYTTLTFSPNGTTPVPSTSTTAPTLGETFDRRWVIEQDQPVAGVRRITVLVTLMDQTVQPPVTFQMSMVRP
jgi:prepilin-type N-terminal cleavage/methylation domain-containing protein